MRTAAIRYNTAMLQHFTEMMAGSLRLKEPWHVEGAKFDQKEKRVDIYVGIRPEAEFVCPECGGKTSRYGYEPVERIWRHADCMFYPTYVHCRRPRVACPNCGAKQINAPFERKDSRHTLYFEGYAMMLMADMPRAAAARALRCNEKTLASIVSYWVNLADGKRSLAEIASLAIDETSFRRGHDYVTLFIDAGQRSVVDVQEGRDKETVAEFCRKLVERGGKAENIATVTSDMSKSFCPAIAEHFPNALHVIDKFHVKQILVNAMEDVRKFEQKDAGDKRLLFRNRKLFMTPKSRMDEEQTGRIAILSKQFPKTGKAFRIVASLDEFYRMSTPQDAEGNFMRLYSWMRRCRLKQMKSAAQTLLRHKDGILAYFSGRVTNAICEGINSIVQAAKRKARGYRTMEGFKAMIYLIAGKLKLEAPSPFAYR